MLERITDGLPRAWAVLSGRHPATSDVSASYTVLRDGSGYVIRDPNGIQTPASDSGVVVGMLQTMLRRAVGGSLRELSCIEATVVTHQGRGLMLPAQALGGTTTLARALVAAGAELHSEEFALIDRYGRLVSDLEVGSDRVANPAVPLGLLALTVYRPGSPWAPRSLTHAEGVVALMSCVPAALERPAETLASLRLALQEAVVLQGDRGEAQDAAAALLQALAEASANKTA